MDAQTKQAVALAKQVLHDQHELDTSAWGGCVWEHTGDALRDFTPVARALIGLIEQYEMARGAHEKYREGCEELQEQLETAQRDNGRLALEAATADQDWKRAEAEANKLRHALTQVRAECDLPDYIAEFVGEALASSNESVRESEKTWGPERMRHDPA